MKFKVGDLVRWNGSIDDIRQGGLVMNNEMHDFLMREKHHIINDISIAGSLRFENDNFGYYFAPNLFDKVGEREIKVGDFVRWSAGDSYVRYSSDFVMEMLIVKDCNPREVVDIDSDKNITLIIDEFPFKFDPCQVELVREPTCEAEKLGLMKSNMEKAEKFAKRCPIFAKKILKEILTGEETCVKYADSYKKVVTFDGIKRCRFISNTTRRIMNYEEKHDVYLFTVYINVLGEYKSLSLYGLDEIHEKTPVFFYDKLNRTFYCTDEQIGDLLEALNDWKTKAVIQARRDDREERIEKLKLEIEKIKGEEDEHKI